MIEVFRLERTLKDHLFSIPLPWEGFPSTKNFIQSRILRRDKLHDNLQFDLQFLKEFCTPQFRNYKKKGIIYNIPSPGSLIFVNPGFGS